MVIINALCCCSFAADLTIGTHASYYTPAEEGATPTLMLGVDADYKIGGYFTARLSIDNSNYSIAGTQYSMTPVTLSLIGHPYPDAAISPYIGGGVGYYDKKINGMSDSTTGIHALAGISMNFQTFIAGIEIKYTIPDLEDGSINYTSTTATMTGGLFVQL